MRLGIWLPVAMLALGSEGWGQPQEPVYDRVRRTGSFTLVADRANLPYGSDRADRPGIDVEVARLLADTLRLRVYYHWINTAFQNPLTEVINGTADLALGVALDPGQVDPEGAPIGDRVVFTDPCYGTGYVAVTRSGRNVPPSLREMQGTAIGLERGAHAEATLRAWGLDVRPYPNQMAVLAAVRSGAVAVGAVWADAGYLVHDNAQLNVQLARTYVPEPSLRVNIGGAVGAAATPFAEMLNEGLRNLISSGAIQRVLARYGVPYYPPFEVHP